MLYQAHALFMEALQPFHQTAKTARYFHSHPLNPFRNLTITRHINATFELFERLSAYYEKPHFNIDTTQVDDLELMVREEVVVAKPYMNLLRFRKDFKLAGLAKPERPKQPRLLIVAPMSGHYATLLRNTVRRLLPELDIYITDWINARDVPLSAGEMHLDDYVDDVIDSLEHCGPSTHVLAICQPVVPVLMALAVMSKAGNKSVPASATFIAGPVDTRVNPSAVNDYASNHDYEWFENNVIFDVPPGFIGEGQRVYPGFMQLSGFLSLNLNDHISKHYRFYHDLVKNDGDSSETHRQFYNEYLAVMDISAPFYLETIRRVFIDQELPRGLATHRGETIDLDSIRDTAIFTVEGEKDDICGIGQTQAAHDICKNIPDSMRKHHVEPLVGHYGAWNGRRFRENVAPMIVEFINQHDRRSRQVDFRRSGDNQY